jgi:hypothetical protein
VSEKRFSDQKIPINSQNIRMKSDSIHELFGKWRGGDAEAGAEMASRFSNWFYAVSSARLGEVSGRLPLERACQLFSQGVASVEKSEQLVPWAHNIIEVEMAAANVGEPHSDYPSQFTSGRMPSTLLRTCTTEFDTSTLQLLVAAYDLSVSEGALYALCEPKGGFPMALLSARYELKRYLASTESIPFASLPTEPALDLAPLVLYETGRLDEGDARSFEQWLLSDKVLCQDVAEYSSFSLSLRSGALKGLGGKRKRRNQDPAVDSSIGSADTGEFGGESKVEPGNSSPVPPPFDGSVKLANPIPLDRNWASTALWLGMGAGLISVVWWLL